MTLAATAAAAATAAHTTLTTAAASATATATASGATADTRGFLSPTGVEIAFLLVGLVTFGAAIVTVTTRQLVHAALWLVVALGGLAVEYLLLTAEFIAWVQVLIYVGSVVVLLLFGLMLTKAPIGRSLDADSGNRWVALGVAVVAAALLIWVVVDAFRATWINLEGAAAGSTRVTGESLFQNWVLPFEALSVLLLSALVGAIVLSRKAKPNASPAKKTTPGTTPTGTNAGPPGTGPAPGPGTGPDLGTALGTDSAPGTGPDLAMGSGPGTEPDLRTGTAPGIEPGTAPGTSTTPTGTNAGPAPGTAPDLSTGTAPSIAPAPTPAPQAPADQEGAR